ncbi:hypothetical protein [Amphibiibacter pelophylacis]|uniref:Uncharacterized protein n=1 Tax=Amphibiibacter pelophylacis TaxID=1799477 RepID=A0ACC6NY29_9BURK
MSYWFNPSDVEFTVIRGQKPRAKKGNKEYSVHIVRFDIRRLSLKQHQQQMLSESICPPTSKNGYLTIEVKGWRSAEQNRWVGLRRIHSMLWFGLEAIHARPTRASKCKSMEIGKQTSRKRLEGKKRRSQTKDARSRVQV